MGWQSRCRLSLARAVSLVALSLAAVSPAAAAADDSAGTVALLKSLNLSLAGDESASAVRVPLGRGPRVSVGEWLPYLSLGAQTPDQTGEDATRSGSARMPLPDASVGPRVDVGVGMNWKLLDRMELFGEYRVLRVSPSGERSGAAAPGRDTDGPELKGGFTIRFD